MARKYYGKVTRNQSVDVEFSPGLNGWIWISADGQAISEGTFATRQECFSDAKRNGFTWLGADSVRMSYRRPVTAEARV